MESFSGHDHGHGAGAAMGMTMAPSRREMRRVAHKAAKNVTEAVETLTDAMGDVSKGPAERLLRRAKMMLDKVISIC